MNNDNHTVSVIDGKTNQVIDNIKVGNSPFQLFRQDLMSRCKIIGLMPVTYLNIVNYLILLVYNRYSMIIIVSYINHVRYLD